MTEPDSNPQYDAGAPPEAELPAGAGVSRPAPSGYPFWNWKDVLLLGGLAIPVLIVAQFIAFGAAKAFSSLPQAATLATVVGTAFIYGGAFGLLHFFFRLRYGRPALPSLGWVAPKPMQVSPAVWGILTAAGAIALGALLRTPPEKTPLDAMLSDPLSIVLLGLLAVTIGPLFEELVFRGFLLPLAARTFGPLIGIALTSLPFALLHGPEYAWSWQRISIIFFAGAAFGWMRFRSGSTAAATVMHATYNATFVLALAVSKYAGV
ncbi:MAG TPA: type II CAAX endopeptidase family protein [Bryobacteraceae bacterium]|nr:type II CAAX endopeptidase family protein [Bryobacteraceae bacterium]